MREALNPTRRDMLGRLAVAAPLAAVAGGALAAPPDPDAELLDLARTIAEADAESDRVCEEMEAAGDYRFASHPVVKAAVARIHASLDRMGQVPAHTPRGLLAKARAVAQEVECGPTGYGEAIAAGLVADLGRLAGEA